MILNQTILEQYAAADEDQRLGLYLIHRDLRQDFMEIDLAEAAKITRRKAQTSAKSCLGNFQKYCLGWLKLGRV